MGGIGMALDHKLVYSTDDQQRERCPRCKELKINCTCPAVEPVPANLVVKLRLERSGRGGKAVTVLYDLPRNPEFLKELATRLKRALGTGGTAKESSVEVQGDYRERLRQLLLTMGYRVKG